MKPPERKQSVEPRGAGRGPATGRGGPGGKRLKKALNEIESLQRRVALLEDEALESRQLNKQLAEIIDVVAEVLLPAENRDDARVRELLQRYESGL